jgi:hydroxyethylthiazole kinase-like sugar kinase family protein
MLSSVVGVYAGAHGMDAEAMVTAVTMFNVASEIAAECACGPGSFKMHLFDAVYGIDADTVEEKANVKML